LVPVAARIPGNPAAPSFEAGEAIALRATGNVQAPLAVLHLASGDSTLCFHGGQIWSPVVNKHAVEPGSNPAGICCSLHFGQLPVYLLHQHGVGSTKAFAGPGGAAGGSGVQHHHLKVARVPNWAV